MSKIGIITETNGLNLGNSLQNYALQHTLKSLGVEPYTIIRNDNYQHLPSMNVIFLHNTLKRIIALIFNYNNYRKNVLEIAKKKVVYSPFDKLIQFKKVSSYKKEFINRELKDIDVFIAGSDQIWNPNFLVTEIPFLTFTTKNKRIAYAASFGVSEIPNEKKNAYIKWLKGIKNISVREESGAKIVKDLIDKDVPVVLDPTLLLSKDEWAGIAKKPKFDLPAKYLLLYFLGERTQEFDCVIRKLSVEYNLKIIDILDKSKNYYYNVGPAEFIYLIQHAAGIYTDSFHGSVFSIIMKKPFVVINRSTKNICDMSSRIDTLLKTFSLESRRGRIENKFCFEQFFYIDFSDVDKKIEIEKVRSINYLKNSLDIR